MIIRPIKSPSKIARVFVSFNCGSKLESVTRFEAGTSHMLEHMMFKGTDKRTAREILNDLSDLGASVNAYTSYDNMVFSLSVMQDRLDQALEIFSDMIINANLPEEEFLKEREVVLQEESSSVDDVMSFFSDYENKSMISGYMQSPILGTKESIEKITIDSLVRFKERFLDIKLAKIFLVSSLKKSESKLIIQKHFGKASGRIKSPPKVPDCTLNEPTSSIVEREDVSHDYVDIFYKSPSPRSGYMGQMILISKIIGGGLGSKMWNSLREDKGLVYYCSSSNIDLDFFGLFKMSFSCEPKHTDDAIESVKEIIEKAKSDGFSEKDLSRAKAGVLTSLSYAMESESDMAMDTVDSELQDSPTIPEVFDMVTRSTLEEVNEIVKDIFSKNYFTFKLTSVAEDCDEQL